MRKLVLVVMGVALLAPATAHAAFPGRNGVIAYSGTEDTSVDSQIYTINRDGSSPTPLTNTSNAVENTQPAWSPDGSKIAFYSDRPFRQSRDIYIADANGQNVHPITAFGGDCGQGNISWSPDQTQLVFSYTCGSAPGIYKVNADGTGMHLLYWNGTGPVATDPAWSPDGQTIAFSLPYRIYVADSDGTDAVPVTDAGVTAENPDWSPDASRIAYTQFEGPSAKNVYIVHRDGSGRTQVTHNAAGSMVFASTPVWSPDGTKIAYFKSSEGSGPQQADLVVVNPDGTGEQSVTTDGTAFAEIQPDWQPIPVNAYPRPKGATPMRISLVTANDQCTAPNRTHGAPLAFPSCSPFQLSSNRLTVGTGDSNGKDAFMQAFIRLDVGGGDVHVHAFLNDIFNKDLSDYTGGLRASLPIQVTDKNNTPSPFQDGAATTEAFPFEFDLGCTATPADPAKGSDCVLDTTFDALVPGAVSAGKRAIWELGQAKVYDGGTDGDPATTGDNTLFAVQGVFVP